MNIETLKEHKALIAYIPIIFHILYLVFSYFIDKIRGLRELFISFFTLPPILIGQVILYFILKLFNDDSNIPIYILLLVTISYIFYYVKRMILLKPYDNIEFSLSTTIKK